MDKTLRPSQVCLILRESAKSGVAELTYCGLHVKFGRPVEEANPRMTKSTPQIPVTVLTEEQHLKQNNYSIEKSEVELRESEVERLMIEDPFKAEQLLRDGELDDGDGATTDDE